MGIQGLDFQVVSIPFTKGSDSTTQPKLVAPGKWEHLRNMTLDHDYTPHRRDGWTALLSSTNGNGLATYNKELLTISGPSVYSVSTTASVADIVSGSLGFVTISKSELTRDADFQNQPDCAYGNGYTCYVWRTMDPSTGLPTNVKLSLVDETTGTKLLANEVLLASANVLCPRVVFADNAFFIFYMDGGGSVLYARVIATSAPTTLGAAVALISSASLGLVPVNFDSCAFGDGCAVYYGWNDGATSSRSIEVVRTGTVPSISQGPTNITTEASENFADILALACTAFGPLTSLCGLYMTCDAGGSATPGLIATTINDSWAVVSGPLQKSAVTPGAVFQCGLTAVLEPGSTTQQRIFWDFVSLWGSAALNQIRGITVDSTLVTIVAVTNVIPSFNYSAAAFTPAGVQGPYIHGKAFATGGRVFLPVYTASTFTNAGLAASNPRTFNSQNTFYLLDNGTVLSGGTFVSAKAMPGSLGVASINGSRPRTSTPCSSPEVSSGTFINVVGELTLLVLTSAAENVSPTGLVRLDMTPNYSLPPIRAQLGESTFFAGGVLSTYDGNRIVEHGFNGYPEGLGIVVNGAGTGAMNAGTHQVCCVYEWVDGSGQRHQSAPSPAVQVTSVATGSLTVNIPSIAVSQKGSLGSEIQLVPYMTQAGGVTFTRVTFNGGAYGALFNTTAATFNTFTIDSSDAEIAGNELLYTQPNQGGTTLANISPGPTGAITVAQNRLWYSKSDQPGQFGFSQQYVNNVGLQFSQDLGGSIPLDAGKILAIRPLDEKVIIFAERNTYVVYGTGPNSSGGFDNYSEPQLIPSNVPIRDARSPVEINEGIIFKSKIGYHILGRDLTVTPIDLEGLTDPFTATVTSAVLLENKQEVRFTTSGGDNVMFVYNYILKQWSFFYKSTGTAYAPLDAVWWPTASSGSGRYVHISLANGLNQDTPGTYIDAPGAQASVGVRFFARTGWLRLADLERFQRVRRLFLTGTTGAAPDGTFTIIVDFDDVFGQVSPGSYTFSTAMATAFPGWAGASLDLRHKLNRQKCKSVAFSFTDDNSTGTQRAFDGIQAIALEIGMKRGVQKLPAVQSVS